MAEKDLKHFSKQQTTSIQLSGLLPRSPVTVISHLADGRVAVDLYTKPTGSHKYLLPTSCRHTPCSKNIPYSLALCIRRLCSDDEAFEKRVKGLSEQRNKWGHQTQVIDQAIEKVSI